MDRHWVVQMSKSSGRQYWFNTKTGVSTYEQPAELRAPPADGHTGTAGSMALAVPRARAQDVAAAVDTTYDDGFSAAELAGLVSDNFTKYRDAVESICRSLAALSGDPTPAPAEGESLDAWRRARQRRLPSHDSLHRAACHEMAEEFGVCSFSGVDDADGKVVILYAPAAPPPEVLLERAEEAALAEEAAARQRAELELVQAAAAARQAIPAPKRKRAPSGAAAPLDSAMSAPPAAVGVADEELSAPRVQKRERRTIEQIQQELDDKRRPANVSSASDAPL